MADIIDQAQQFELLNLAQSLQVHAAVAKNAPRVLPQGYCLNRDCMDEFDVPSVQLYCGPKCAMAHDRQIKNHRR